MKDVKICADCLRDMKWMDHELFDRSVIKRSDMTNDWKSKLDRQFWRAGLLDVYLCKPCWKRFTDMWNKNHLRNLRRGNELGVVQQV